MHLSALWTLFCTVCGIGCLLSISIYVLPLLVLSLSRPQDIRKKYGDWAVVTGASSGIGKALARKLAAQGVNVCMVALDDAFLSAAHGELCAAFPAVELRRVGVDLSRDAATYMRAVAAATADVRVAVLFNNAGFLPMGFFERLDVQKHVGAVECNALAAVRLTHHFYGRMVREGIKGGVCFTSSAACFLPTPFATMYGGSKSLLTHFGTSLSLEAYTHGIDVTVLHPSYTHSRLYADTPQLGVVALLARFGWTPDAVADVALASLGRCVVRDLGVYAVVTNVVGRCVDAGGLAHMIRPFVGGMAPPEEEGGGVGQKGHKGE